MTPKWLKIAVPVLVLAVVAAAPVAAKRHHARHAHYPAYHPYAPLTDYAAPIPTDRPRMVEVRPGLWISTWDCFTDEGQGRWKPCSTGRH